MPIKNEIRESRIVISTAVKVNNSKYIDYNLQQQAHENGTK